jgi:uncharacterized protein YggT (Ycf19 family)
VVWYLAGLVEALLGLRFLLRLIGANPAAGFVEAVNTLTDPLVAPFRNIVAVPPVNGGVFDWNTLIAMAVYWLIAWAIIRLFFISRPVTEEEARTEISRDDHRP